MNIENKKRKSVRFDDSIILSRKEESNEIHSVKKNGSDVSRNRLKNEIKKTVKNNHKINYTGDRFFAHRGATNFDNVYNSLMTDLTCLANTDIKCLDLSLEKKPGKRSRKIKHNLNQKSPSNLEKLDEFYNSQSSKYMKPTRNIPTQPEKILKIGFESIERIRTSWNENGLLAIGLDYLVILWDEKSNSSSIIHEYDEDTGKHVSSLVWIETTNAPKLAIGNNDGELEIVEINEFYKVSDSSVVCEKNIKHTINIKDNTSITSLAFANNLLTIGLESGIIEHHTFGSSINLLSKNKYHKQKISKMIWSADKNHLAVITDCGLLSVWESKFLNRKPKVKLREKNQRINDISWNPRNSGQLVFCSGKSDCKLRIIDVKSKQFIKSVNTNLILRFIYWSKVENEILCVANQPKPNPISDESIEEEFNYSNLIFFDQKTLGKMSEIICNKKQYGLTGNGSGDKVVTVGKAGEITIWKLFPIKKTEIPMIDFYSELR